MSRPRSSFDAAAAAERIHYLLGISDSGAKIVPHDLFCEMMELAPDSPVPTDAHGEQQSTASTLCWTESARWIKFEEDVEEGGDRWSKPHVATLCLRSLFELRSYVQNGVTMFNVHAPTLDSLVDAICEKLEMSRHLAAAEIDNVRNVLLLRQVHFNERSKTTLQHSIVMPLIRSLVEIGKKHSTLNTAIRDDNSSGAASAESSNLPTLPEQNNSTASDVAKTEDSVAAAGYSDSCDSAGAVRNSYDFHFMRKLPTGSEAANILVGEVAALKSPVVVFVQLDEAVAYPGLTEVPLATRFFFLLLGPRDAVEKHREVARGMGALLSDGVFQEIAYRSQCHEDLLIGIDEFLGNVTVLPPGEWDPSIRIEPPQSVPSQDARRNGASLALAGRSQEIVVSSSQQPRKARRKIDPEFIRTGRLFGGLVRNLKRKWPWYWSDFRDALDPKCLAAIIFLYFAALSQAITFGAMLRDVTGAYLATIENIISAAACGIIYALFSGQPLTLLSSTGPVLIFEKIVFQFSRTHGLDFLAFRCWIGLWSSLILLLLVAFDVSAYVRYITRFTEETFACLISLIFIWEALINVCKPGVLASASEGMSVSTQNLSADHPWSVNASSSDEVRFSMVTKATSEEAREAERAATYFSILLFLGTFLVSWNLRKFDKGRFFAHRVRNLVTDFSVVIAIVTMSLIDLLVGSDVEKLDVPNVLAPTNANRAWLVDPFRIDLLWMLAAVLPAMFSVILIFMDQQITSVIVNRKQNKLKKGHGYHLDLLVVAFLAGLSAVFGLPTYVAATVLSISHVMSLKRTSRCAAPGEMPKFLGCREQRVTALVISLLIGLSVLLTCVLKLIPMPVLYGVFLYMGLSSLEDMDLIRRLSILLMPAKYQPDLLFLRHVPMRRVHLFTLIQAICLISMWALKSIEIVSIGFPITVLAMCFVRKSMDFIFTQQELKWLDSIIPSASAVKSRSTRRRSCDRRKSRDEEGEGEGGQTELSSSDNENDNDHETKLGTCEASSSSTISSGTFGSSSSARLRRVSGLQTQSLLNRANSSTLDVSGANAAAGAGHFYNINLTEQLTKTTIWRQLSASIKRDKRIEVERRGSRTADSIFNVKSEKRVKERDRDREFLTTNHNQRRSNGESLMNRVLQSRRQTFSGDRLIEHVELNKLLLLQKSNSPSDSNQKRKKKVSSALSYVSAHENDCDSDHQCSSSTKNVVENDTTLATNRADRRGSSVSQEIFDGMKLKMNARNLVLNFNGGKTKLIKKAKAAKKTIRKSETFGEPQIGIVIDPPSDTEDPSANNESHEAKNNLSFDE